MRATLNGSAVDESAWRSVALTNYGHFTSLLVRDRAVQGLDLHLQRLADATRELFGTSLDPERTQRWMREAVVDGDEWQSMRVTIFSRAFDRERPADPRDADVLIATAPAQTHDSAAISAATTRYQRDAPQFKHVGTFGLFQQRLLAQRRGYDDVLFVDRHGLVSEGSVWNIGFFDSEGEGVVWPQAGMLDGVSQRLLQCGLAECAVRSTHRAIQCSDLASFRGAFFTNSRRVVVPIHRIDDIDYAVDPRDAEMLRRALATQPWQPL
ncbi:MAG: aminotransferase class IV [Dokdonella sp.]